ncbi:MAG: adenosylhomocysteinase [Candidatus Micrarchaeota archaeon]|nr:adenosylhomocysteinase [Candidatus Micrarchaeota archaeon]
MLKTIESKVKDPLAAKIGIKKIEWAKRHMPLLFTIAKEFEKSKPFEGLTISICLHLEKKTAVLIKTLAAGGAKVYAASCNPDTTDDDVAAALAKEKNVKVFAWSKQTKEEYYWCLEQIAKAQPNIIIDDGNDLTFLVHQKYSHLIKNKILFGGCEETTTGVKRLYSMQQEGALKIPMIAVNNAYSKYLLDNQFGTAQSTVDAIINGLNILVAGKTVVVLGYGWCGRGIASRFKALGANVVVVEVEGYASNSSEPGEIRALTALYDGYRVLNHSQAAKVGDIFICATGNINVLRKEHFLEMKDGAILANAGHFDVEIDKKALVKLAKEISEPLAGVKQYTLKNNKKLYLLSEGRLVNLAKPLGQGHPIEIMDGSFALQALSSKYLAENRATLKPGVLDVPKEIDRAVARLILKSNKIELDSLTQEQLKYLNEWKIGT